MSAGPTESFSNVVEISPPPSDGVTRVAFAPCASRVLLSSWSGSIALHASDTGHLLAEASPTGASLLDACWIGSSVAVASLDGSVQTSDIGNLGFSKWNTVGSHTAPVKALVYNSEKKYLTSGGWDGHLNVWDMRRLTSGAEPVEKISAGGKVFGAARYGEHSIVFITSERLVRIVDLRNAREFVHDKMPSALKYQLRGISSNYEGTRYAVGSTEGRVVVDWPDHPSQGYSFRCHRIDGLAFPINTIAHNQKYNSFATGGGDGHVSFWDAQGKKRIAQYPRQATSISSLDFSSDSSKIAVAVSYTFEEGEKDHPTDAVQIRSVKEEDIAVS